MCIARFIVTLLTLFFAFAAGAGQEALLNRLQVDHEALIAAQRDYQRQREQGTLGAAETADYADYVARLRERVSQDCLMLVRADIRLSEDFRCSASLSGVVKPASIDQRSEQTSAERTATMDAELNAGLGEFDEMLLREQERVKAAAPRSEAGGSGGAGSGQGGGQGDSGAEGGQTGDAGESGDVTGSGEQPASRGAGDRPPSGAAGGRGTQTGASGQAADIPDGSDDDLVARQMREAAEKETNPELKKKLWEEYRKYKQGAR
ncbi:MAG: hypothetical protein U9Q19_03350 [Pseudomonadota bacterium]|nr:hypothetical protein [Pseudomonadota bacterium]